MTLPNSATTEVVPPQWLASRKTWLLWSAEPHPAKPGKTRKIPYYANGRKRGTTGTPEDLSYLITYDEACAAAKRLGYRVGLAITDGLGFVDLDDQLDGELVELANKLAPTALVEVSQSGKGLHIIGTSTLREGFKQDGLTKFEAYTHGRFCAWTGNIVNAMPEPCNLDKLISELRAKHDRLNRNASSKSTSFDPLHGGFNRVKARKLAMETGDNRYHYMRDLAMSLANTDCDVEEELRKEDAQYFDGYCFATHEKDILRAIRGAIKKTAHIHELRPPNRKTPPQTDLPQEFDLEELAEMDLPPIEWLVQDFLPPGLSLLASPPKFGKSYLTLQLALCVADGQPFLSLPTRKCDVLYYDLESGHHIIKNRLMPIMAHHDIARSRLKGRFHFRLTADPHGEAVNEVDAYLTAHPGTKLVVIDLFQMVRGEEDTRGKSAYQLDYAAFTRWRNMALSHPDVAVILVHHTNKGKHDNWQDQISGSNGIAGATHTNFVLSKFGKQGMSDEEREAMLPYALIQGAGKQVKPFELVIRHAPNMGGWELSPMKSWEVTTTNLQDKILKVMALRSVGELWTAQEVTDELGPQFNRKNVVQAMWRMGKQGLIEGQDKVGYRLKFTPASETKFDVKDKY